MGMRTIKIKNKARNFRGNAVLSGGEIHSVAKTVAEPEQRWR